MLTNISALTDGGSLLCLVTHILSSNDFLKVARRQRRASVSPEIGLVGKQAQNKATFFAVLQKGRAALRLGGD